MSTPPSSMPRRVPPPCWTQDETLALIEAYRDKWFSVNRGNLRAADWDAVAASVAESSAVDPPKSALQCRHKIEKLRKRYRTEKQRCVNFQGRFFSSWELFPLLDAMSIGSGGPKRCQDIDEKNEIDDGFRVKTLGERYSVAPKKCSSVDQDLDPDFDAGLDPELAFRARKFSRVDRQPETNVAIGDMNSVSVAFRPKDYGRNDGKIKPDIPFNCGYEGGVFLKLENTQKDRSFLPQLPGLKGYGKIGNESIPNNRNVAEGLDGYIGFPLRTLGDLPAGYKPRVYRKSVDDIRSSGDTRKHKRDKFEENAVDCWESPPAGCTPKNYCKAEVDSKVLNGNAKRSGVHSSAKKGKDPIKELVSAFSLSTNTFLKVEKMKMEMAMEIEKMRMDMLLKHNQMILEAQQQIVDAFANTTSQNSRKKGAKG